MSVTIKDVAKEAQVSVTTTSYALNNSGPVSEEKRERIFAAAKNLGYVPSGVAKSLQAQKMGFIGYFAYSLGGPVFGEMLKGVEDACNRKHIDMVACCCSPQTQKVTRLLKERMIDGAIIFVEHIDDSLIKLIASDDCPIVVMDRDLSGEYISSILIDNSHITYEVGRYIAKQEYKSIGYITGSGFDGEQRSQGFLKAIQDFSLNVLDDFVLSCGFQERDAYDSIDRLLKGKPDIVLPEIIFAFSDEMAIGAIRALENNGYSVPNDVSIIGMDDIPLASYVVPKLTTIHRPIYELGVAAVETLYDMMKNSTKGTKRVLPSYFIERESCIVRKNT